MQIQELCSVPPFFAIFEVGPGRFLAVQVVAIAKIVDQTDQGNVQDVDSIVLDESGFSYAEKRENFVGYSYSREEVVRRYGEETIIMECKG